MKLFTYIRYVCIDMYAKLSFFENQIGSGTSFQAIFFVQFFDKTGADLGPI